MIGISNSAHDYVSDFEVRIISSSLFKFVVPSVNDGIAIEELDGGHDAFLEFLFGRYADMAQHGASQLGEEALDEVEPRAMRGSEGELEAAGGLLGEPRLGLPGDMCGMIVEDEVDRGVGRIGFVETLEERDKLAAAMAVLDHGVNLAGHKVD